MCLCSRICIGGVGRLPTCVCEGSLAVACFDNMRLRVGPGLHLPQEKKVDAWSAAMLLTRFYQRPGAAVRIRMRMGSTSDGGDAGSSAEVQQQPESPQQLASPPHAEKGAGSQQQQKPKQAVTRQAPIQPPPQQQQQQQQPPRLSGLQPSNRPVQLKPPPKRAS